MYQTQTLHCLFTGTISIDSELATNQTTAHRLTSFIASSRSHFPPHPPSPRVCVYLCCYAAPPHISVIILYSLCNSACCCWFRITSITRSRTSIYNYTRVQIFILFFLLRAWVYVCDFPHTYTYGTASRRRRECRAARVHRYALCMHAGCCCCSFCMQTKITSIRDRRNV